MCRTWGRTASLWKLFNGKELNSTTGHGIAPLTNIGGIAEHGEAERPLDGQSPDHQGRKEYAADHNCCVNGTKRYCSQAVLGVDGRLEIGDALEGCELDHEGEGNHNDVLEDSPFLGR